jgi:membrane protein CcdC involved in cytochrome C biogenesis
MKTRKWLPQLCVFTLAILLPYLIAWSAQEPNIFFGGLLINPIDGNSYLAKMMEGYQGAWLFHLPYSAEPGEGSLLFLYYLSLGHLARFLNLPLIFIYHLARIFGALLLFWALTRVVKNTQIPENLKSGLLWWLVIGSGMGWVVTAVSHELPVDFWVAETYPFLASYANPHFPLALALMLFLLEPDEGKKGVVVDIILAFLLSVILPFGAVIVLIVLWGEQIIRWTQKQEINWKRPVLAACSSLPFMLYDVIIVRIHPQLAVWNAQNQTPSPSFWLLLLAFLPGFPLAIYAIYRNIRQKQEASTHLVIWAVVATLVLFIPISLQRRFMLGLYIPITILAGTGLGYLCNRNRRMAALLLPICVILTIPSNLIVLGSAFYGIKNHDAAIYLTSGEVESFEWIKSNTGADSIIMAAPDTGLLIPAYTGRKVLYGHPYETIHSEDEKMITEDYYSGDSTEKGEQVLKQYSVDFVYYGPREKKLGQIENNGSLRVVYNADGVEIYAVR